MHFYNYVNILYQNQNGDKGTRLFVTYLCQRCAVIVELVVVVAVYLLSVGRVITFICILFDVCDNN